jgi:hypothetical protein
MVEVIDNNHAQVWNDYFANPCDATREPLRKTLERYNSGCDYPICEAIDDLRKMYPDAKILLTTRDPESWYKSCLETVYAMHSDWSMFILQFVPGPKQAFQKLAARYFTQQPHKDFKNKDAVIAKFHALNQHVIDSVPADNLLIFRAKDVSVAWLLTVLYHYPLLVHLQ